MRTGTYTQCLVLCALAALEPGCAKRGAAPRVGAVPRVETFSSGPVEVSIVADPPVVDPGRDMLLTVRLSAPAGVDARLPPLNDRFEGFTVSGEFEDESRAAAGKVARETHLRLTPDLAGKHRVAPLAVTYTDNAGQKGWFATRPITFDVRSPYAGRPEKDIREIDRPVWIAPSAGALVAWGAVLALLAAGIALAWKFRHKIRRAIRVYRMPPKDRALNELAELIARDLPGRNLVKEFYFELTMIVRRYIERAHRIRAPEQTTEEFLDAASRDARFGPAVVARLRAFLEAADLVKYAAFHPAPEVVGNAVAAAKNYIETDAPESAQAAADA